MRVATERLSSFDNGGAFKAKLLGLICLAAASSPLLAVNCTPDSITLSSQSEVDGFQANHGPCDTIVELLIVSGGDITDLTPLSGITTGNLNSEILIHNNPSLSNLDGLSGLASVYWIEINGNQSLTSISGLSNLGSVSGPLIIQDNTSLTNVDGLESLTNLTGGALFLMGNDNLSDLSGLSNLTNVNASLAIRNNGSLATLDDLSALESVGSSIGIHHNDMLTSITGLSGVSGFSGWLEITGNPALGSLEGVSGMTSLEGLRIRSNPLITNVDNLSGVTTIGNVYSAVEIYNNASLENLDGLAALVSLNADLWVTDNPQLDQCSGLETLLDQVDDALPGPGPGAAGIPDINGDVLLGGNLSGCNAVEEIIEPLPLSLNGANFIAGEAEFLLKGFGVTRGCLEPMIRLPGPMTFQSRELLLACSMQDYAEDETLVFRAADKSCTTLHARNVEPISYELPVHVPHSSYGGSLEEVSDAMFLEDDSAFLALNLRTQELTRAGTVVCASTPMELPDELTQIAFLKASNVGAGDLFGDKIAASGMSVVVGAPREDGSATQVNGPDDDSATDAGAAYVFMRDSKTGEWPEQAYLKASNAESGDRFGSAVAIDENLVVVGAPNEDGSGNLDTIAGAAYVFLREGGQWSEQAILRPWDITNSSLFGSDVAISGDTVVVGAYDDDRAYVFVRNSSTGQWDPDAILQGSNTTSGDSFGRGIAIDGDTIVVGAFAEDSDATGVDGPQDNDNAPRSGAAYVFVRSGEDWIQQAYLKASNTDSSDQFGGAASISGNTLVIGTFHESSNATGIDGDQSNNFATDSGAAYFFVREGESWSQQAYVKAPNTAPFDSFAASVSVSGNRIAISAPREDSGDRNDPGNNASIDSGAAYLYAKGGATWTHDAYIKADPIGAGDWFGRDIAIAGNILAVGALLEDSGSPNVRGDSAPDAGAAYVLFVPDRGEGDLIFTSRFEQ